MSRVITGQQKTSEYMLNQIDQNGIMRSFVSTRPIDSCGVRRVRDAIPRICRHLICHVWAYCWCIHSYRLGAITGTYGPIYARLADTSGHLTTGNTAGSTGSGVPYLKDATCSIVCISYCVAVIRCWYLIVDLTCLICLVTGNGTVGSVVLRIITSGAITSSYREATRADGVHITDALTLLICTRSVGITCAHYDMCCITVVCITGSVHNRMVVMNSSGALEFLVYELSRNTYGVRRVLDATESSWVVGRITSVHQDLFYIVFCICYTTGTTAQSHNTHSSGSYTQNYQTNGVQSYGRHWFQT